MDLAVNQVILWESEDGKKQFERILWISKDMRKMYVINLKSNEFPHDRGYADVVQAISSGEAQIVKYLTEPEQMGEIDEDREEEIEKAWKIIQEIVAEEPNIYDKSFRGLRIRDMQKKWEVSRPTIVSYLKRYWQAGKLKVGLINRYDQCGGPGTIKIATEETKKRGRDRKITELHPEKIGINVTERVLNAILFAKTKFIEKEKLGFKRAFDKMNRKFFVSGYRVENGKEVIDLLPEEERVEYSTFRYRIKKLDEPDPVKPLMMRYGDKKYNLQIRDKTGNNTQTANGPGTRFQIDATIADIQLVSRYDTSYPVGKPVVYTVIDTFSHMYCGLYIGFEGPSYLGALMAMLNTGSSKVKFCEKYGIHITEEEWPCSHLPQQFTADRGEMLTNQNWSLRNVLGVDIEFAAPYRADMKPLVESYFNVMNHGLVHRLPGASSMKLRERGTKDPALNAILTIDDFTYLTILWILKHNNTKYMHGYPLHADMVKDEVKPIPVQLWNWGRRNRGSALRVFDEDVLKLNLLPKGTARITDKGLMFKGVAYTCERAKREGWFLKAFNGNMGIEVGIAFDPRWTNNIYLKLDGGMMYEECWIINSEHLAQNRMWDEFEQIMEIQNLKYIVEHREMEVQAQARYDHLEEKRIELAKATKEDNGLSDSQKVKGKRANRSEEKEEIRKEEHAFNRNEMIGTEKEKGDSQQEATLENVSDNVTVPRISTAKRNELNPRIQALHEAQNRRRNKKGSNVHA